MHSFIFNEEDQQ